MPKAVLFSGDGAGRLYRAVQHLNPRLASIELGTSRVQKLTLSTHVRHLSLEIALLTMPESIQSRITKTGRERDLWNLTRGRHYALERPAAAPHRARRSSRCSPWEHWLVRGRRPGRLRSTRALEAFDLDARDARRPRTRASRIRTRACAAACRASTNSAWASSSEDDDDSTSPELESPAVRSTTGHATGISVLDSSVEEIVTACWLDWA